MSPWRQMELTVSAADRAATRFLAKPASSRPLAALRIGLSVALLLQAATLAPAIGQLYGSRGFVQWPVAEALSAAGTPRIRWVAEAMQPWGISADTSLRAVFVLYVAGLSSLLLGWRTRVAAVAAWLGHLALCTSGTASVYGVDAFARISLFYCVVMPVGHAWSLDHTAGRVSDAPTFGARLGLRVLQIHVCIAYFAAGLSKALGEQWWNGEAIWRALNQPTLAQFDAAWLAQAPWLAMAVGWGTVALEMGYPVFVWPRLTRRPWVLATILLHLGTAVGMGLVSFAAVMIVLNIAAFWIDAEPPSAHP